MSSEAMKTLYVLYDPACGVCCHAWDGMIAQSKFIELRLLPVGSRAARDLFLDLLGISSNEDPAGLTQKEAEPVCVPRPDAYDAKTENTPTHALRVAHESWLW